MNTSHNSFIKQGLSATAIPFSPAANESNAQGADQTQGQSQHSTLQATSKPFNPSMSATLTSMNAMAQSFQPVIANDMTSANPMVSQMDDRSGISSESQIQTSSCFFQPSNTSIDNKTDVRTFDIDGSDQIPLNPPLQNAPSPNINIPSNTNTNINSNTRQREYFNISPIQSFQNPSSILSAQLIETVGSRLLPTALVYDYVDNVKNQILQLSTSPNHSSVPEVDLCFDDNGFQLNSVTDEYTFVNILKSLSPSLVANPDVRLDIFCRLTMFSAPLPHSAVIASRFVFPRLLPIPSSCLPRLSSHALCQGTLMAQMALAFNREEERSKCSTIANSANSAKVYEVMNIETNTPALVVRYDGFLASSWDYVHDAVDIWTRRIPSHSCLMPIKAAALNRDFCLGAAVQFSTRTTSNNVCNSYGQKELINLDLPIKDYFENQAEYSSKENELTETINQLSLREILEESSQSPSSVSLLLSSTFPSLHGATLQSLSSRFLFFASRKQPQNLQSSSANFISFLGENSFFLSYPEYQRSLQNEFDFYARGAFPLASLNSGLPAHSSNQSFQVLNPLRTFAQSATANKVDISTTNPPTNVHSPSNRQFESDPLTSQVAPFAFINNDNTASSSLNARNLSSETSLLNSPVTAGEFWSVALQTALAIAHVHRFGQSLRCVNVDRVAIGFRSRVRILLAGVEDAILPAKNAKQQLLFQQIDLIDFAVMLCELLHGIKISGLRDIFFYVVHNENSLTLDGFKDYQNYTKSNENLPNYSSVSSLDLNELHSIKNLIIQDLPSAVKDIILLLLSPNITINQVIGGICSHAPQEIDRSYRIGDDLEIDVVCSMHSSRLFRLLLKLVLVADRSTAPDGTSSDWGETQGRFLVKLFRDFLITQQENHLQQNTTHQVPTGTENLASGGGVVNSGGVSAAVAASSSKKNSKTSKSRQSSADKSFQSDLYSTSSNINQVSLLSPINCNNGSSDTTITSGGGGALPPRAACSSSPVLDLSFVIDCLNKLDAGSPDRIPLFSADFKAIVTTSFKTIRTALDTSFNELTLSASENLALYHKSIIPQQQQQQQQQYVDSKSLKGFSWVPPYATAATALGILPSFSPEEQSISLKSNLKIQSGVGGVSTPPPPPPFSINSYSTKNMIPSTNGASTVDATKEMANVNGHLKSNFNPLTSFASRNITNPNFTSHYAHHQPQASNFSSLGLPLNGVERDDILPQQQQQQQQNSNSRSLTPAFPTYLSAHSPIPSGIPTPPTSLTKGIQPISHMSGVVGGFAKAAADALHAPSSFNATSTTHHSTSAHQYSIPNQGNAMNNMQSSTSNNNLKNVFFSQKSSNPPLYPSNQFSSSMAHFPPLSPPAEFSHSLPVSNTTTLSTPINSFNVPSQQSVHHHLGVSMFGGLSNSPSANLRPHSSSLLGSQTPIGTFAGTKGNVATPSSSMTPNSLSGKTGNTASAGFSKGFQSLGTKKRN